MKRLLAFCIVLVLAACSSAPPLDEGYVREKKFTPAHWEDGYRTEHFQDCGLHYGYDPWTGEYGMNYGCEDATRRVYESHHEYVDDAWSLYLEDCQKNDKGEMKCRKQWRRVDEGTFDSYDVGQHFPDPH